MADPELLEELRNVELRLAESNERMERAEQLARDTKHQADKQVSDLAQRVLTKEYYKRRRRQAVAIACFVTLLGLVAEHSAITKCFLTPAQTGWNENACAVMFPGYREAREQSQENLAKFQELISQVPVNQERITNLEQRVATVEQGR